MKIISTNLAVPTTFEWNGKTVTTGIYKKPIQDPIYLTKDNVFKDEVSDRVHHGGYYKACYVFSKEQYPYWRSLYPQLDWNWGMFGENLTLEGFDESKVIVGSVYRVGEAVVQISQYREPCYKLGHRFGTQEMLKQFVAHGMGGTYLSILKEGLVQVGDPFTLIEEPEDQMTVAQLFQIMFSKEKDARLLAIAAKCPFIPQKKRLWLASHID